MSPWIVVSCRTVSPLALVMAARSPETGSAKRLRAPLAVSSTVVSLPVASWR